MTFSALINFPRKITPIIPHGTGTPLCPQPHHRHPLTPFILSTPNPRCAFTPPHPQPRRGHSGAKAQEIQRRKKGKKRVNKVGLQVGGCRLCGAVPVCGKVYCTMWYNLKRKVLTETPCKGCGYWLCPVMGPSTLMHRKHYGSESPFII
jgi:hypothetical protein